MTTLDIPVPELVKRYQAGEIPASARATVTYEPQIQTQAQTQTQTVSPSEAISSFEPEAWDDETPLSGEELEAERRLFEEFETGINEVRRAAGMRTL